MSTLGIAHINIRAPRALLDQLYAFYREVVGLQDGPRPPFTRFGYWLYASGHDVLHLIEASPEEQRLVNVSTTIDHIAFKCTDLPETTTRLQQRGIPYRVTAIPLSQQQQIVLKDPAGNTVELNFADAS